MLSGKPPFEGDNDIIIDNKKSNKYDLFNNADINNIITKSINSNIKNRYGSTIEFISDIKQILKTI